MVSEKIVIELKTGLHARPASRLAALCKEFKSTVVLYCGAKQAAGNSIIRLLSLGLKHDTEVQVTAEGEDEALALQAVLDFIKTLED